MSVRAYEKKSMQRFYYDMALRCIKALNVVLIAAPFVLCWYGYYTGHTASPYDSRGNGLIILIFVLLYGIFGRVYGALQISFNRISELVYGQVLACVVSDGILYLVILLLSKHLPHPGPLLLAFGTQAVLSALWSLGAHRWYFSTFPAKETYVVYDRRRSIDNLIAEYGLDKKFKIGKCVNVEMCLAGKLKALEGAEVVFLCGIHSHERNIILKYCVEHDIKVYVLPRIGDVIMSGAEQAHLFHLPLFEVGLYRPTPEYRMGKRIFDVILSLVGIILTSPIMLITAIAIKAEDGGSIFYKQCRLTQGGRKFYIIKFRSMRADAEADGIARLSTGDNDNRITKVGRFIRKVRIDELPQLFNILEGSMSIVGPRPERPVLARQYEKKLPEFALRLQAKAGLTGYAQVYGKYNTTPYDKLQMDLMYLVNAGFALDLRIIFKTVQILFLKESTEGVEEEGTTAEKAEINEVEQKRMTV